jgi:recombination protein RecT|nr:MAG TPA: RecT protein [Caudoviricetes sp.]
MATKEVATVKTNVGDSVIARVNSLCEVGFKMPADYQYVNAIKASMLVLQDLKDKNGKPALEACTQNSIASALFEMSVKGLDASRKTCYFIVRGDKLCLHESYFGKVLQVKRIYPNFDPHPVVIREGDEFIYEIDPKNGCKRLVKHTQCLENLDKGFVGAYMYLPTADGGQDLYIMSKRMILTAWSKSSSREQTTAKQFDEKMVMKTIINSGCNMIINSTPDLAYAATNSEVKGEEETKAQEPMDAEYEEISVNNGETIDLSTGEVIQPSEEKKNEPEF